MIEPKEMPLLTPEQAKQSDVPCEVIIGHNHVFIHDPERPDRLARMLEDGPYE